VYHELQADRIVGESNFGGDMVEAVVRTADPNVPYKAVTASRGKKQRAEPIAALYEGGRISHVGTHVSLEDEMVTWDPVKAAWSPGRIDAMVWAATELMLAESTTGVLDYYRELKAARDANKA
jgi:phage terminase large subunit-like protein